MTKDSVDFMGLLDELLGTKKKAPKQNPYYGRFRRFCKKHGITYTVDSYDGYIDFTCANGGTGMFYPNHRDWCEAYYRITVWMKEGQDPNTADEMPWPGDEQPTQPPGTDEAQRLAEANARFAERRKKSDAIREANKGAEK